MRDIKFRAWDNRSLFEDTPIMRDMEYIYSYFMQDSRFNENLIFQQFTGLKDKNGKDIYEGDILLIEDQYTNAITDDSRGPLEPSGHLTPVIFKNSGFGVDILETEDFWSKGFYDFCNNLDDFGDIEVIGNIYENPELLETK